MDHLIYTAMNGAMRIDEHQSVLTNNLANVNTAGFKEHIPIYVAIPFVDGISQPTRVSSLATTPTHNFQPGIMQSTGRPLDVAISGEGWFAIQTPQGDTAYTRAGGFQVGVNGLLQTAQGYPVLSAQNAPIEVPAQAMLSIASDGTISAAGAGDPPDALVNLGQLKLVNPPTTSLVQGDDGLFRGGPNMANFPADPSLRVVSGVLEGSNVSAAKALISSIENSKRFEMQMQVISHASTNEQQANGILSIAGS